MRKRREFLTEAQLRAEIEKCEFCREKPCREACPADVSPADFIMAARVGAPSDYRRAAALIMGANPLGGVCGAVCPEKFCVQACAKADVDSPVRIPAVQAEIIRRANRLKVMPHFPPRRISGIRIAVVGAGPAGLAAAALLAQNGLAVEVFERDARAGGMVNLIPDFRFNKDVLRSDIRFLAGLGRIRVHYRQSVDDPRLLARTGDSPRLSSRRAWTLPLRLGIPGEERTLDWIDFLSDPARTSASAGRRVAVIGGGAVAADCAETAARLGASVEMICLETPGEMPLTSEERDGLLQAGVLITGRSAVTAIRSSARQKTARIQPMRLPRARPSIRPAWPPIRASRHISRSYDEIIVAIGARSRTRRPGKPRDLLSRAIWPRDRERSSPPWLRGRTPPSAPSISSPASAPRNRPRARAASSCPAATCGPCRSRPISSAGRSCRPSCSRPRRPRDGVEQLRAAYRAGWAGGVLKTAFDGVPIHIPSEYMFVLGRGDLRQLRQRLGPRPGPRLPRDRDARTANSPTG